MIDFEKIKIYHYMAWKNRGLFLQKIKVFFLKKIEVFFFANRPLQRFNPLTKVYWKIRAEPRQRMRNGTQMKKKLTVQWTAWMAASASVGLNFRAPRTWSGRCMRNSETPAGFKPKRWPKKVDAKVCLTRPSNPLKTLGPEPRLVCFIQRSNPIQTLLPRPRQRVERHTRPSNRWETLAPEPRQRIRNGTQMKKKLTVQWTASEWQLRPRLAWTSGPREHGVDDATAKPQQDSSPRGGPKRFRMRRQGVPNPTFEPVIKTLAPEPRLVCFIQRSNPIYRHSYRTLGSAMHAKQRNLSRIQVQGPKRSRMRRQGVPIPTFEPVKNTRTWASAGMLHPTFKPYNTDTLTAPSAARPKRRNTTVCLIRPSNRWETLAPEPRQRIRNGTQMKKKLTVQWTAWMAASASVGLNFRAPRTWSGRCMRNSETPPGFKPKRWPKKVPNATPRCAKNPTDEPVKNTRTWASAGICFIQRSNPIQTLLPRPRQRIQNGETPRCASPDLRTVEKH